MIKIFIVENISYLSDIESYDRLRYMSVISIINENYYYFMLNIFLYT